VAAITNARNRTRQRPKWVRRTKQVIAFGTIIFLACFAALFLIFLGAYRKAEDSMSSLDDRVSQFMVPPSVIVDRNGVVLYRVSSQNRRVVHLSEVPEFVRNAMIAAEDRRFYSHSGVDPVGLGPPPV
jgi:membrane peptidoglycan carboxypeptidase